MPHSSHARGQPSSAVASAADLPPGARRRAGPGPPRWPPSPSEKPPALPSVPPSPSWRGRGLRTAPATSHVAPELVPRGCCRTVWSPVGGHAAARPVLPDVRRRDQRRRSAPRRVVSAAAEGRADEGPFPAGDPFATQSRLGWRGHEGRESDPRGRSILSCGSQNAS